MQKAKARATVFYSRHFDALFNNIIIKTWTAAPSKLHIRWLAQFALTRHYDAVLSTQHGSLTHFCVFLWPKTAFYLLTNTKDDLLTIQWQKLADIWTQTRRSASDLKETTSIQSNSHYKIAQWNDVEQLLPQHQYPAWVRCQYRKLMIIWRDLAWAQLTSLRSGELHDGMDEQTDPLPLSLSRARTHARKGHTL